MPGTVVLNPATVDGYGNPISVTRDGYVNRVLVSGKVETSPIYEDKKKVVVADFYTSTIVDELYGIVIDVDNGSGTFKHIAGTAVKMVGIGGSLFKERNSDIWRVEFGAILSIDATEATIGWVQVGSLFAGDTTAFVDRTALTSFPVTVDFEVSGGDYTKIAAGKTETTTDVNTSETLTTIGGVSITPAVGDLVGRVTRILGNKSAEIEYSIFYYVE